MPAELYLDDDIDHHLAPLLRARGIDATSTLEAGTVGQPDEAHLILAASLGRALVSYNYHDYLRIGERWYRSGREHAGIILSFRQYRRGQVGELLQLILQLLNAVTEAELRNTVRFLDEFR